MAKEGGSEVVLAEGVMARAAAGEMVDTPQASFDKYSQQYKLMYTPVHSYLQSDRSHHQGRAPDPEYSKWSEVH